MINGARRGLRQAAWVLIALWSFAMIGLPIALWTLGDRALVPAVWVCVLLQAAASVTGLCAVWGTRAALTAAAAVALLSFLIEVLGSHTGVPFGRYTYTPLLEPKLLGVPLLIPAAWMMILPAAWAVAERITGRARPVPFLVIAGLAFAAWDLYLDPQMVHWGFWTWEEAGSYFGIPWLNYFGWLVSAIAITIVVRPGPLPPAPALPLTIIYALTWALQGIGLGVFWGLGGPAAVGLLGMGVFVVLAFWLPAQRNRNSSERGAR